MFTVCRRLRYGQGLMFQLSVHPLPGEEAKCWGQGSKAEAYISLMVVTIIPS